MRLSMTRGLTPHTVRVYREGLVLLAVPLLFRLSLEPAAEFSNREAFVASVGDASGSTTQQFITLFIFFSSWLLAIQTKTPIRAFFFALAPTGLYLAWAVISWSWSEFPHLTLRRSARLVIETVSILLVALTYRGKPQAVLAVLFWVFAVITLTDLASLLVPSRSLTRIGFNGLHLHKNDAGAFFFCALPVFAIGILDRSISSSRLVAGLLFVIGSGLLAITQAKTSILCVPLSLLLVAATRSIFLKGTALVLLIIYLIISTLLAVIAYDYGYAATFDLLLGDATLTGRSDIWRFALSHFEHNPWIGTGYGALWQTGPHLTEQLKAYNAYTVNEAHNGYIDILAQSGLIGLGCVIIFLCTVLARLVTIFRTVESHQIFGLASYALYLFFGLLVFNITESAFFKNAMGVWAMFLFVCSCATIQLLERKRLHRSD